MSDEEKDIITVGKRNDDNAAVWDRHEYHPSNYGSPEGEVFISDMRPYEVHRSRGIQQKIGEKELQELGERAASARLAASEDTAKAQEEQRKSLQEQSQLVPGATFVGPGVVPKEPVAPVPNAVQVDDPEDDDEAPDEKPRTAPDEGGEAPSGPQVRRPSRSPGS